MTIPARSRFVKPVLRLSATVTTLFVVAVVGAVALVDTRPVGARAIEWAAREAAVGTLPTTLDEVAALPPAYRRAAFLKMSPEQRSALWVEQFSKVETRSDLSNEQRAIVSSYKALLTPDLYDKTSPRRASLQAAANAYCAKIQALFSDEQRWQLRNIGENDTSGDSDIVRLARFVQNTLGIASVSADDVPDCRCANGIGACNCTATELCKEKPCTVIEMNCGCGGGAVDCDRLCEVPIVN